MCNCIADSNLILQDENSVLITRKVINVATKQTANVLALPTKKLNSKIKLGPVIVLPSYCPFCGVRIEHPKS